MKSSVVTVMAPEVGQAAVSWAAILKRSVVAVTEPEVGQVAVS